MRGLALAARRVMKYPPFRSINQRVGIESSRGRQQPPLDPRPHRSVRWSFARSPVTLTLCTPVPRTLITSAAAGAELVRVPGKRRANSRCRRIGSQYVTEPLQHTAIAHITRREFPHQLREYCSKHPCEAGSEPVIERRGDQRLARRTLIGPTKPRQVRSDPVPNPSTTHQNIALGSTLRRRRIAPLSARSPPSATSWSTSREYQ